MDFVKTMAMLGGILALVWAALRLWLPRLAGPAASAANPIEIVARRPLEPRKTLYVVRVGKTTLLVAAAGEAVTLLDHVECDPAAAPAPGPGRRQSFAGQLAAWRGGGGQA